jgi:hypothetical protein
MIELTNYLVNYREPCISYIFVSFSAGYETNLTQKEDFNKNIHT